MKDIIKILGDVYYSGEWWSENKLSREDLDKYHEKLLNDGNIIYLSFGNEFVGYIEFWRINYKQLGQIVCDKSWSAYCEDITSGNICYVNNIWICEKYRRDKEIDKSMKDMFFKANSNCEYFIWERMKKKSQTFKVFNRKEFILKMEE